jgi:hypothetical protein
MRSPWSTKLKLQLKEGKETKTVIEQKNLEDDTDVIFYSCKIKTKIFLLSHKGELSYSSEILDLGTSWS